LIYQIQIEFFWFFTNIFLLITNLGDLNEVLLCSFAIALLAAAVLFLQPSTVDANSARKVRIIKDTGTEHVITNLKQSKTQVWEDDDYEANPVLN